MREHFFRNNINSTNINSLQAALDELKKVIGKDIPKTKKENDEDKLRYIG